MGSLLRIKCIEIYRNEAYEDSGGRDILYKLQDLDSGLQFYMSSLALRNSLQKGDIEPVGFHFNGNGIELHDYEYYHESGMQHIIKYDVGISYMDYKVSDVKRSDSGYHSNSGPCGFSFYVKLCLWDNFRQNLNEIKAGIMSHVERVISVRGLKYLDSNMSYSIKDDRFIIDYLQTINLKLRNEEKDDFEGVMIHLIITLYSNKPDINIVCSLSSPKADYFTQNMDNKANTLDDLYSEVTGVLGAALEMATLDRYYYVIA